MSGKQFKKTLLNSLLYLFVAVIFWLFFLYIIREPDLYIFPEAAKQGDTVFIKAKTKIGEITGVFDSKELSFFKKGKYQWLAYLGIDAKLEPGSYKLYIDFPNGPVEKEIKVEKADFYISKMPLSEKLSAEGYTEQKIIDNMSKKDTPALNDAMAVSAGSPYFDGSFSFPLAKTEKNGFGFGSIIRSLHYELSHYGVDLRAAIGQEVLAANRGKVVMAEMLSDYGNTVVIDHGLGIFSLYLHLSEFKVSLGQMVEKKQVIGLAGNTGYSTGPHLHFSIKLNKDRVDPLLFIQATRKAEENIFLANIKEALLKIFY